MKKILALTVVVIGIMALAGCKATDVVGKMSVTSFDAVLGALGNQVTADENNKGWALQSPGGERLILSKDFSTIDKPDLIIQVDAKPFLDAGLNPDQLNKKIYLYDSANSKLMIWAELGKDKFSYSGESKPLDTFKQLVATHRERIKYHEKLDHYGVALGNGNMFEWAKDLSTNDKDMVFVLDPKGLMDAGVDPTKVKNWTFAKVEVKNDQGQKQIVDKFLKPYNLK